MISVSINLAEWKNGWVAVLGAGSTGTWFMSEVPRGVATVGGAPPACTAITLLPPEDEDADEEEDEDAPLECGLRSATLLETSSSWSRSAEPIWSL